MGLAGVLPYMATSLSTVYCAWEINHAADVGTGLLLSEKNAELMLHIIEPIQVGYGAVVGFVKAMLEIAHQADLHRSSPSSVLFTGVLNGLNTAAHKVTSGTQLAF